MTTRVRDRVRPRTRRRTGRGTVGRDPGSLRTVAPDGGEYGTGKRVP
ncbi:hypothetical protein ACFVIN_05530 [Streptomyces prasinus]